MNALLQSVCYRYPTDTYKQTFCEPALVLADAKTRAGLPFPVRKLKKNVTRAELYLHDNSTLCALCQGFYRLQRSFGNQGSLHHKSIFFGTKALAGGQSQLPSCGIQRYCHLAGLCLVDQINSINILGVCGV